MPIPFIIAGLVAAGTAIATSKTCDRCDDTFWSSDCNSYCQDCCDERKRKRRKEEKRERLRLENLQREQEREIEKKAKENRKREDLQRQAEVQRRKKAERDRLKAIEDDKRERLRSIEAEKERQRIVLERKSNKKRHDVLTAYIADFEAKELASYASGFQDELFLEIDKEKNKQLKKINNYQRNLWVDADFNNIVKIYMEDDS